MRRLRRRSGIDCLPGFTSPNSDSENAYIWLHPFGFSTRLVLAMHPISFGTRQVQVLSPGSRLGPYDIQALIGEGGMGEVYRAHDTRLKRDVALKVLPQSFASDLDRLARFEREAQVLASLNHPTSPAFTASRSPRLRARLQRRWRRHMKPGSSIAT